MDVRDAQAAGDLSIERTDIIINAGIVKWSGGEMAVDDEKTAYLGKGMLLEPIDTTAMTATFKLGQCYPGSRYFVLDHSMAPNGGVSPRLHRGPSEAGATGPTNVFMNGLAGPGPIGFQPSAFDFTAGNRPGRRTGTIGLTPERTGWSRGCSPARPLSTKPATPATSTSSPGSRTPAARSSP